MNPYIHELASDGIFNYLIWNVLWLF